MPLKEGERQGSKGEMTCLEWRRRRGKKGEVTCVLNEGRGQDIEGK